MQKYTTRHDVNAEIVAAIESGGSAFADEYDLDAIADECYPYNPGQQAFVCTATTDEFWASVQRNARALNGPRLIAPTEGELASLKELVNVRELESEYGVKEVFTRREQIEGQVAFVIGADDSQLVYQIEVSNGTAGARIESWSYTAYDREGNIQDEGEEPVTRENAASIHDTVALWAGQRLAAHHEYVQWANRERAVRDLIELARRVKAGTEKRDVQIQDPTEWRIGHHITPWAITLPDRKRALDPSELRIEWINPANRPEVPNDSEEATEIITVEDAQRIIDWWRA